MDDTSLTLFDDWLHKTYAASHGNFDGEVVLVRDSDAFREFSQWLLSGSRPIAYDIEATGLNIYSDEWEIKSIQWGDTKKAYVFIWREEWFQKSIDMVMERTDYRLLAHNATFDALGLDRHGHVFRHNSGCLGPSKRFRDVRITCQG